MDRRCDESPPGELLQAFGEFNRGDWFECHETLEDLWVGQAGELRDFYQGVLQIAVALHHWRNGNFSGAVHLLESGVRYLRRVSPACQRIDVRQLIAAGDRLREALSLLGPDRMAELDLALIPKLRLVPATPFPAETSQTDT
jgi:predicted metal-dependent hydrolase